MRRLVATTTAALAVLASTSFAALAASPGTNPFTDAISYFNPDAATAETYTVTPGWQAPGPGYRPAFLWYQFCWPPTSGEMVPDVQGEFKVSPDGALTGSCVANTAGGGAHRESTITGTYDLQAQTVKFEFEGTQTGNANPHVATLEVDGPVTDVVGDRAEGTATFVYTCTPAAESDSPCGFVSISGTVAFAIQFQPSVATESPATPTPAPTTAGPLGVALACSADVRNVNCSATPEGAGDDADLSYAWTFNGGPQPGTGSSFQYDFIEAQLDNGSFPVSVTVTDNNDGRTASASDSVELGTFGSVAESSPNTLILLLILAGAGAAIIGAFMLWLRGRAPKPDFAALAGAPDAPVDAGSFAVGSDRAGGFEDSLEYGEGAGMATPASSKAYEALVVASSRQAAAEEPLVNPEGEVAETAREDEPDESRTRDRGVREVGEGR